MDINKPTNKRGKYSLAQNAIQAVLEPFSAYLLATTNTAIAGFSEQSGASCRDLWGRVGWAGCEVDKYVVYST